MHKIDNLKLENFWEHIEEILPVLKNINQNILHEAIENVIYRKAKMDEHSWMKLVEFVLSIYTRTIYFNQIFDYTETEKNSHISLFHNDRQQLIDMVYNKNKGKYCKSGVVFGTPIEINELPEEKLVEDEVTV